MSLGPPAIALYRQLKTLRIFDAVHAVVEMGGGVVKGLPEPLVREVFAAFGRLDPPAALVERLCAGGAHSRELYEGLGLRCTTVDPNGGSGALKLDVVTGLAFGRYGELRSGAGEAVLRRVVRDGAIVRPTPDDRFWALLLHVLLDRGDFPGSYARELESLLA